MRVYLAGPITGLSYDDAALGWRKHVHDELKAVGIESYSPMRGKGYLKKHGLAPIPGSFSMTDNAIVRTQGILGRDHNDVQSCDLMFVNLLDAQRVSIGTMVEFGWATAYKKPIITIMQQKGCVHDHAFVHGLSTYRVDTVEEGLGLAKHLLLPGVE